MFKVYANYRQSRILMMSVISGYVRVRVTGFSAKNPRIRYLTKYVKLSLIIDVMSLKMFAQMFSYMSSSQAAS